MDTYVHIIWYTVASALTISFKVEHKQIKISELKNLANVNVKQNKIKLESLRSDLK